LIQSESKRNFQKELNEKEREIERLRKRSNGNTKIITEKHTEIIEKFTHEKITLQTEINRLTQQILILKEKSNEKQAIQPQAKSEFVINQEEKRKVYDKLLLQERTIESLRNKLNSAEDDNHQLRIMLQNNEEGKFSNSRYSEFEERNQ
jgi:chromosome segregation ATPase